MDKKYVINIGRQLGSGGLMIGEKLSRQLDIAYYDKELIHLAAQKSGLCKEFFERADEKTKFSFFSDSLGWLSNPMSEGYLDNYLHNETLFRIQSDVIRQLAEKQSCIFIGRCADYILRDHPCSTNIFITADLKDRIQRVAEKQKVSRKKAEEVIERTDKHRARYYNYYTNKEWGVAASYHLCINSSTLGIDETACYIREFIEKRKL